MKKKINHLTAALQLCLMVIFSLFVLSLIPEISIGNWKIKKPHLFSQFRRTVTNNELSNEIDSLSANAFVDKDSSSNTKYKLKTRGRIRIEDYSSDSTALYDFLSSLVHQRLEEKPMHIAFYGDSFIEGDIFCGSVRDTLQTLFGGRGVGFVPITSDVAGFRNTIKHEFEHFETHSLITKRDTVNPVDIGPAGYSFRPQPENWVEYRPSKQRYLREFSEIKLYYKNEGDASLQYIINDSIQHEEKLKKARSIAEWKFKGSKIKSVRLEFKSADSVTLYGASFEQNAGIYVDNFSLRGNTGISLDNISTELLQGFNRYRDYKLIILQYGLNVINEDSARYSWYAKGMIKIIEKLKRLFPQASILLVGVSDRSTNVDGEFKTIEGIRALRNAQRYIARKTGIAFWDMYEAMGGEGSMVKFVESKPPLAAKDYTHLTFKGGKKLAQLLVKSLLYERDKFVVREKK